MSVGVRVVKPLYQRPATDAATNVSHTGRPLLDNLTKFSL